MSLTQVFISSRKIHRLSFLVTIFLALIMGSTGTLLKYPSLGKMLSVDGGLVRYTHREISIYFSIALVTMATTGLAMYFIPELNKLQQKKTEE